MKLKIIQVSKFDSCKDIEKKVNKFTKDRKVVEIIIDRTSTDAVNYNIWYEPEN